MQRPLLQSFSRGRFVYRLRRTLVTRGSHARTRRPHRLQPAAGVLPGWPNSRQLQGTQLPPAWTGFRRDRKGQSWYVEEYGDRAPRITGGGAPEEFESVAVDKRGSEVMKRIVPVMCIVVASTVLLPTAPLGVQAQHVYAWGEPLSSASSRYQYQDPTTVTGIAGTVVQVSATNSTSYTLTTSGQVWAWGAGQYGALGNGVSVAYVKRPVQVRFPAGVTIASLPSPMPYDVGLAIDTKGNVWGWGYNLQYPLCLKQGLVRLPTKLPFTHVTLATGAGWHALYEANGKLYACGKNAAGELGDGTTTSSSVPVAVVGLPHQPIKALVSSWEDSGALLSNGSFYDWGYNSGDQLGNDTMTNADVPVHVTLPDPVAQIAMGGSMYYNGQTIALLADGSTWAWGTDQFGQLGIGKVVSTSGPTVVEVPHGVRFVQVSSGGSTMYAIDASGDGWAWGVNNLDQLGVRNVTSSDVPIPLGLDLSGVSATAANVAGWLTAGTP